MPPGVCVYAIGDIHGRVDLLQEMHRLIAEDAASRTPGTNKVVVYLGDYVDRGLDSREVIDLLVRNRLPDCQTVHLLGTTQDGELAAYLRILAPGVSYPQVSFGRVLTAPAYRGRGLGDPMIRAALAQIESRWPGHDVQIGAQAHLQHYYGRHGFVPSSDPYLDDGIPHIDMLRRAATGASA